LRDKKKIPFGPNTTSTRQAPQDKQLERERERERERGVMLKEQVLNLWRVQLFRTPKIYF
jgi:hypothetical protein